MAAWEFTSVSRQHVNQAFLSIVPSATFFISIQESPPSCTYSGSNFEKIIVYSRSLRKKSRVNEPSFGYPALLRINVDIERLNKKNLEKKHWQAYLMANGEYKDRFPFYLTK